MVGLVFNISSMLMVFLLLCLGDQSNVFVEADHRSDSRSIALKARARGQEIWDLRQRIAESDNDLEKDILRSVLESMFVDGSASSFASPLDGNASDSTDNGNDNNLYREPIVFLHIPRTGGHHLYNILEQALGTPQPRSLQMEDLRDAVASRNFTFLNQPWFYINAESTVIRPFLRMLKRHSRRPRVVTFLRDPIERVVSEYYAKSKDNDGEGDDDISLQQYVTLRQNRDRQVRFLNGKGDVGNNDKVRVRLSMLWSP